jgi:hypothetical protein
LYHWKTRQKIRNLPKKGNHLVDRPRCFRSGAPPHAPVNIYIDPKNIYLFSTDNQPRKVPLCIQFCSILFGLKFKQTLIDLLFQMVPCGHSVLSYSQAPLTNETMEIVSSGFYTRSSISNESYTTFCYNVILVGNMGFKWGCNWSWLSFNLPLATLLVLCSIKLLERLKMVPCRRIPGDL